MTAALSDSDVLTALERGRAAPPLERPLVLLAVADPASDRDALARVPIGERDRRLLDLLAATTGGRVDALAACPACAERVELAFPASSVRCDGGDGEPFVLERPPYVLRLRLPATTDLAAVAVTGVEPAAARRALAERCIVEATCAGEPADPPALPDEVVDAAAAALGERDPQADIRLDLTCPSCGEAWVAPFDVASFLWAELEARARTVLGEVHALASAYGWPESEILAMGSERRRLYLELLDA